jgi:hypothetical protein
MLFISDNIYKKGIHMNKKYLVGLLSLVLLIFLIGNFGCSTMKSFVHKVGPGGFGLKKRVMFLPIIDLSNVEKGLTSHMTADLVERLKKSPQLLLYEPSKVPGALRKTPPGFGIAAQPELLKKAEDLDMNAIISGVLNPIEITSKKTGIWPFRKSRWFFKVSMIVNVIDVIRKTILLSHLESRDVPFSLGEAQSQSEKELVDQALKESLPRILKRQASSIIESLEEKPWTGKILGIDNGTIKINAGEDIGLKPGHCFEVFARGESIPSVEGRVFFLLGKKIGEIKASKVMGKYSLAVPVKEGQFLAGQVISSRH